jgi:hypothetical protein
MTMRTICVSVLVLGRVRLYPWRLRLATFCFASWQPMKSLTFTLEDGANIIHLLYLAKLYLSFSERAQAAFAKSHC